MTSLATSGRLHGRHLDFYATSSLSETVSPNFTKVDRIDLHTLGHVPAKRDVINYFLSARHFNFLHYVIALVNGLTEFHQIWYA